MVAVGVPGSSANTGKPVRVRGFEPPRAFAHRDLNPARMPSFATPACAEHCVTEAVEYW